jgi:tRNA (guanosine-2'-O-)-methyltransferase
MRSQGWQIVAVEREGATPLPLLSVARRPTVVLLGHEHSGIPSRWVESADVCVKIPMIGGGSSLNVAVADSLVLYRLAGFS